MAETPENLQQLLDKIAEGADDREEVSLGVIVEAVGSRSFGPLLLMAGVIMASPLSGIPGMPTTMAVLLLTIAIQLILGKKHFWLPKWMLKRSISRSKLNKALKWLRPPARLIDRWLRPRLTFLVHRSGTYFIAVVCAIVAFSMPAMELVPFSATGAGAAFTAFGLALVANDGLLAVFAMVFTTSTLGLVIYNLV